MVIYGDSELKASIDYTRLTLSLKSSLISRLGGFPGERLSTQEGLPLTVLGRFTNKVRQELSKAGSGRAKTDTVLEILHVFIFQRRNSCQIRGGGTKSREINSSWYEKHLVINTKFSESHFPKLSWND